MSVAALIKSSLKGALLPLLHRRTNASTLTVAMFHRVVRSTDPLLSQADPGYTVTDVLFADCLRFFARHYQIVSTAQVEAAWKDGVPLPAGPCLLISFDDGWRDNLTVAAPLLRQAGLPSLLYVATDALTDPALGWWQDDLVRCLWQAGQSVAPLWASVDALHHPAAPPQPAPSPTDRDGFARLLLRVAALPDAIRRDWLARNVSPLPLPDRQMLTPAELPAVQAAGMAVGGHGAAHLPLSLLDPAAAAADLQRAGQALRDWLQPVTAPTLSFPHGRYSPAVVESCRAAGFGLLFTSDPYLNRLEQGRPSASGLLGRIEIATDAIAGPGGRLDSGKMAGWLFRRPIR